MLLTTTLLGAKKHVLSYLKAGLVPMLHGSPGIGKSDMLKQVAKELGLFVIDWRATTADPTDLTGLPMLDGAKATYKPFDTFPIETDKIPKGYKGWLLLLDELPSAPRGIQAAAYKLVLDREVGQFKLHPNVFIVAAGNLKTDNAVVNPMGTAMQSRLAHLVISVDKDEYVSYAREGGYPSKLVAFVEFKPQLLHNFDPKHSDLTFSCPRTWEFVKKYWLANGQPTMKDIVPIAGLVGVGAARELLAFLEVFSELPAFADILANPKTALMSDRTDTKWALASLVADNLTVDNATAIMEYVSRMGVEFQMLTIRQAAARLPALVEVPAVDVWLDKNARMLV